MQAPLARQLRALLRDLASAVEGDSPRDLFRKTWVTGLSYFYLHGCTRVGSFPRIQGRPRITNQGILILGDRIVLRSIVTPIELLVFPGGTMEIGDRTFINYGTSISATGSVRIGKDCHLGMYTIILDNEFHTIEDRRRRPGPDPIVLEDNVWLGHRTLIMPGVTIGRDSVIGAGSVVTADIPARCVAVGTPARVIRTF